MEGELTATGAEREAAQAATSPAKSRAPHTTVAAVVEKAESGRWRTAAEREEARRNETRG